MSVMRICKSVIPKSKSSSSSCIPPFHPSFLPSFCVTCYSLVLYYSCVQSKSICGIVAGGVFPHPPAVAQLCTLLPPPGCFRGPFVAVDLLMDVFSKIQLPETGEICQGSHCKRPEVYCVLSVDFFFNLVQRKRQLIPPECWYPLTRLHGVITQGTII